MGSPTLTSTLIYGVRRFTGYAYLPSTQRGGGMRGLISRGGIAGPALAFWLHRAGAEVTVVERSAAPRPGGHAVDVRGVARDVIERMGLREAIRARQVDERGVALVDKRGRRMSAMPADM